MAKPDSDTLHTKPPGSSTGSPGPFAPASASTTRMPQATLPRQIRSTQISPTAAPLSLMRLDSLCGSSSSHQKKSERDSGALPPIPLPLLVPNMSDSYRGANELPEPDVLTCPGQSDPDAATLNARIGSAHRSHAIAWQAIAAPVIACG